MTLKLAWNMLAEIFSKWNEHKVIRMGAALAYYGIYAIAPVLMIAIAIAGDQTGARTFARQMTRGQR